MSAEKTKQAPCCCAATSLKQAQQELTEIRRAIDSLAQQIRSDGNDHYINACAAMRSGKKGKWNREALAAAVLLKASEDLFEITHPIPF